MRQHFSFYKKISICVMAGVIIAGCSRSDIISTRETPTVSPEVLEAPTVTIENSDLELGESSFIDSSGVFSVTYPKDYTLDTQDPTHPRIYRRGEMQRPESEISDGALVVFEVANIGDQTLEEFVDARIEQAAVDGTSEVTKEKEDTTVNDFAGFMYSVRGLGESTNYIIRKDPNSQNALIITTLVADPENTGYQAEVDALLNTVELLK